MRIAMPFACSICEEESTRICSRCTKDTCANHLCERCGSCSDCCDCEIRLDEDVEEEREPGAAAELMNNTPVEPESESE